MAADKVCAVEENSVIGVTLNVRDQAFDDDVVVALIELPGVDSVYARGANFNVE